MLLLSGCSGGEAAGEDWLKQKSVRGHSPAVNRYYSNAYGRFMTPDFYGGGTTDPQSWNRYSYTRGDPVNRTDSAGLQDSGDPCDICITVIGTPPPDVTVYFNFNGYGGAPIPYTGAGSSIQAAAANLFQANNTFNQLGSAAPLANSYVLQQAVNLAMQALNLPSCEKLFGPLEGPTPAVLLLDLYAGTTSYGSITFNPVPESTPGTVTYATTASGLAPAGSTTGQALITLQTQGPGALLWDYPGNPGFVNAAATLIHELGHAANLIFGDGASSIATDTDNTAQSMANQNTVLQDCFGSSMF